VAPGDRERDTEEELTMGRRITLGVAVGALAFPIAVVATGFFVGGFGGATPCHSAPDFFSSALFGAQFSAYFFGLPAAAAGLVVGAIVGAVLDRWKASLGTIAGTTIAVATMASALLFGLIFAFRR
jgi:hypothetical protein